jgi:hypothetical protein
MSKISNNSEVVRVSTSIRYEADLLASHTSHGGIAEKVKTMNDFYLLSFHQDKVMNAAKQFKWPAQLIERYSDDRGLRVLFTKLLLPMNEGRKVGGPLQVHLALAKDGTLDIKASPALMPGALFPIDLSEKKTEPFLSAFGTMYQRSPIRVLIDDLAPS